MNDLPIKLEYQEFDIDDIFRYFAKGFEPKSGHKIVSWKTNYDPHTGKVIFTLYVEGDDGHAAKT